ncbi:hypothetical protein [Frondihabitans cladoniiphilus]|uniref:Uncharacterized protein n=1 Tax=Frondihabitans cladoniiphilus TaxID=715785 RepID=A0ABP8VT64_9MICO
MSTITHRWTKDAIIARLAASKAIDNDTTYTPRERAERRIELFRVSTAVDEGRLDAESAEAEFWNIRGMLLPLSA